MALALDISRQLRSAKELSDLIVAISTADASESEPDWLEWKREADLSSRRWHALIGKFIVGFANRDPAVASRATGGCAYLVIGVEPGNLAGVNPIDNADLHAGVSRFVRETVRWNPQYIEHRGRRVLVITVEPPESGDQIAAMLRAYQSDSRGSSVCREGDVFIRRHGNTDLATQDDFDMLVNRFGTGAERANTISVQTLGTVSAITVECGPVEIDAWCSEQRRVYLEPLGPYLRANVRPVFENRSPRSFRSEVESYLLEVAPLLRQKAHADALDDRDPGMRLTIVNETDYNFAASRVDVYIEGEVWAYGSDPNPEMPVPPREWGYRGPFSAIARLPSMPTADFLGPLIDNSGPAHIQFNDVDLRPRGKIELDAIHLVCDANLAGATITATWTATSTSVNGVARGEFPVAASSDIVSPLSESSPFEARG